MADDIITSLEIIEKLLFPETDFWHDNYIKDIPTKKCISQKFVNKLVFFEKNENPPHFFNRPCIQLKTTCFKLVSSVNSSLFL